MDNSNGVNKVLAHDSKIAVIGVGHVGLPTALGLAELGWNVIGADQDGEKIRQLKEGHSPFYEPSMQKLLTKHLASGHLTVTDDVGSAIRTATVLFICVGTPQRENGEADLSQIEVIARLIAHYLNGYKVVVEKSTVPAVTSLWIKRTVTRFAIARWRAEVDRGQQGEVSADSRVQFPAIDFDVASNPEFLQEGKAIENFFYPDRIVLGVKSTRAREMLEAIYRPLNRPILVTDLTTAELIKHAANAFLAMKISYINMVADVCESVGADVTMVGSGLGLDPRIGPDFLNAGVGFGGYCFPKDLKAFRYLAEKHGVNSSLLRDVERINQERVEVFLEKLRRSLWIVRDKKIGIWGLAFKPSTDDIREAPSIRIVDALIKEGACLQMYDPEAMPRMQQIFPEIPGRVTYCSSPYQACESTHALLLLTEWEEFRAADLNRVAGLMDLPILLDGRNVFNPDAVVQAGLEYISIGRKSVHPSSVSPLGSSVPFSQGWDRMETTWR